MAEVMRKHSRAGRRVAVVDLECSEFASVSSEAGAVFERAGDDLVFSFNGQGGIVLRGFYAVDDREALSGDSVDGARLRTPDAVDPGGADADVSDRSFDGDIHGGNGDDIIYGGFDFDPLSAG